MLQGSGGGCEIRTHAPVKANGFQDRLVMTTSITLRKYDAIYLFFQKNLFPTLSDIQKHPCNSYCHIIIARNFDIVKRIFQSLSI